MKKNIRELMALIQSKCSEMNKVKYSVSNRKYTSWATSHGEALCEKSDIVTDAFNSFDEISNELLRLTSIRNDINMCTYGTFKDKEYRLIDLISLIKIKQEQYSYMKSIVDSGTVQTQKDFSTTTGINIYKEFNGNVELLMKKQDEIKNDIDELQSIIDMLNVNTYIEI